MNLQEVSSENFSSGRAHGTLYYIKGINYKGGVLLMHGMFGNRYGMETIAHLLARHGYFCFSIDLPGHFMSFGKLSLGEASEMVRDGVYALKTTLKQRRVAFVSHSLGAIAGLFSITGYNMEMEAKIPNHFNRMCEHLNLEGDLEYKGRLSANEILHNNQIIEDEYTQAKALIFNSLKTNLQNGIEIDCYVFIAPPKSTKAAIPGVGLLRKFQHSTTRSLLKMAKPITQGPGEEELKRAGMTSSQFYDGKSAYWGAFRVPDAPEFVEYLMNVYEHDDFMSIVERIATLKKKEDKTNFLQYYLKNYIYLKPKLFIYGTTDHLIRPFLPFNKKGIETYYNSCGNAQVIYGSFNHLMKKNVADVVGQVGQGNEAELKPIVEFLDRNMGTSGIMLKTPFFAESRPR